MKKLKKIGLKLTNALIFAIAFFTGPISFSYAQHSDIWLTLVDNQVAPTEINSETNSAALIDLTTGKFLYPTSFGTFNNPDTTDNPGFQSLSNTFNPNDYIYYRAVGSLWFWNGQAWVENVVDQERVRIRDVVYSNSYVTEDGVSNPEGAIAQISGSGSIHQHIDFFIENLGSDAPAIGVYMIDIELFVTNTPGGSLETHLSSDPVRIAFNYQMSEAEFSDAINALTSQPELEIVSVPIPNGVLFLLAVLLLISSSYRKPPKTIER